MRILLTISFAFILLSCGGGGDTPAPPPAENKAPTIPSLVYPSNNLLCINNTIDFSWNGSTDPEGDNITYEIMIAKDAQFTQGVQTNNTASLSKTISLDKGVAYYWKIRAVDSKNKGSEYTASWGFYTEGVGVVNYLPFAAGVVKPNINSTVAGTSIDLEWTASDLNSGDILTYDLYFGTSSTPPLLISNHTIKTYTVSSLLGNTTYYWRIDVKDNKGGKSTGQIWSFKTS